MSDTGNTSPGQVAPETLELRARPEPVTRVNRKVLIGGAAVGLILISGLILVALKPPTFRGASPQESSTSPSPTACRNCRSLMTAYP